MNNDPSSIDSAGDGPTRFGKEPPERDEKPEQPAKPGLPPEGFRIPSSDGELDTFQAEKQLGQFVGQGMELPPELVEEQKAVLLRPGDVVADRFEVVKQLGFGGMGAVYHVKDRYTRQDRALKVMLPSLLKSHAARERFRSEVTISQKLSHDKIVRVHDLAADRKRKFYFFTMELVEGKTLNRLLRDRGGKLPLDEALDIVRQLCDALEYAHRYTIHRDLKPQNIMIRPDGSIKVLDFGLAKLMSPGRMTRSSMALGTAYYQAPEQSIHLSELDQRADIYSVGVILYQMLTGEIPAGRFEPLARVVRGLPRQLSDIVDRCLDPKPEGRFASAGALREALEQAAKVKRPKWLLPVVAATVILAVVVIAAQLGTVSSKRSKTGQFPTSPSQSSDTRVETDPSTIPEGPSPTESTPTVPLPSEELAGSSSTAAEASTARQGAVVAQQAAQSAGAEEHALEFWDEAVKQLKQAEAHDTLEAFDDAISGYETAANAFKEAETEAARIAGEMKVLEGAQQAMAVVKAEADAFDAAQYAKVRYEQAIKAEEEADAIADDRVGAAEAYQKAAQRYQLAVDETKQQGAAIVAAAKKGAEDAKAAAQTEDVKQYAAKELGDADKLMKNAGEAGSDFEKARTAYADAAAKYAEAMEVTPERKQAEEQRVAAEKRAEEEGLAKAKGAMESARETASAEKAKLGADEQTYAKDEIAKGDAAWKSAKESESDFAKAERLYIDAAKQYAQAIEVTPQRKAAQEQSAAAQKQPEEERPVKAAEAPRSGKERTVGLGGGVSMEMVWIPSGEFMMGSPSSEANRVNDETQHKVRITQGFWMGKYEVTQAQWQAVMGNNPSEFKGKRNPVERVSWNDCQEFVKKLIQKAGGTFRLPTEAEWEYACRAGTTTAYHFGDDRSQLADHAWCGENSGNQTHPVGQKKPNAWGLYDMHGNVWEWCEDWYGGYFYDKSPGDNPRNTSTSDHRVVRGGGWLDGYGRCRSANRGGRDPGFTHYCLGFRVVCESSR